MTIRVTRKTARLLRVLLDVEKGRQFATKVGGGASFNMSSYAMMREARLGAGNFYPIIARLERHGWVEGEWEVLPEEANRPRRRFYHLTEPGLIGARSAVKEDDNRVTLTDRLMRWLAK